MSNELTAWQCASSPDCRSGCLHCFETALRAQIAAEIRALPRMTGSEHFHHGRETATEDAARIAEGHDCDTCTDCIHNGNPCCGCYDGACCQGGTDE